MTSSLPIHTLSSQSKRSLFDMSLCSPSSSASSLFHKNKINTSKQSLSWQMVPPFEASSQTHFSLGHFSMVSAQGYGSISSASDYGSSSSSQCEKPWPIKNVYDRDEEEEEEEEDYYLSWTHELLRQRGYRPVSCNFKEDDEKNEDDLSDALSSSDEDCSSDSSMDDESEDDEMQLPTAKQHLIRRDYYSQAPSPPATPLYSSSADNAQPKSFLSSFLPCFA
ncbi:uncharacterized protein BYT42DRAFT_587765 [Radiomyces spectabilis]|uniref:uncharacterized protein n=1 Tax=Radiomyces spectabilis TaxID=64574 RepID=UPI002220796B|nr:uncharacterized protein BYT42DRAFT_587765 [Radiomyces spectabilis]KAI8366752.1 hypothetical protein BYT42DRAFT_587765 [Radiomyces spectabilis]